MNNMQVIGSWAFIIGLVIAVVMGFFPAGSTTIWILAFLGLVVGLINVTHGAAQLYLVASIAFLVSASSLTLILPMLKDFLTNIVVFVGPGAAIVALRALYEIARSQ